MTPSLGTIHVWIFPWMVKSSGSSLSAPNSCNFAICDRDSNHGPCLGVCRLCCKSETKNLPKDRSFRPDVPADIRPKTSVRPSESWKNKHSGTDVPRGRPRKNFGLKNFGLIFRSLVKTCAVRPVLARVVGELRAADPSNLQGPVKQNASPGDNLRLRDQGGSRGRSRNQDQKTRTVSTCWSNPGGISLNVTSDFLMSKNTELRCI